MENLAIGIDIGGTKVEGALVDPMGNVVQTLRQPSPTSIEDFCRMLREMVRTLSGIHPIQGIGFSVPGSIDPLTYKLRNAPNSPAINGRDLQLEFQLHLPFLLAFENDANCMLSSEMRYGAAKDVRNVVGIILGTGVGGGVSINGKIFKGHNGLAPEPGHLPIDINGRICECGNRGCVEAYLSGKSILKRFRELGGRARFTRSIFRRWREPASRAILSETAHIYARFIAMITSIYDPEMIVLGGGLSNQKFFYQQNHLIEQFLFGTRECPKIVPAAGGDASGKLGAALLIFDLKKIPTEPDEEETLLIDSDNIWGY